MPNTYEQAARWKKAEAIANLLHAHHITAQEARTHITPDVWNELASRAGVNSPTFRNGQSATVDLVIELLEQREKAEMEAK